MCEAKVDWTKPVEIYVNDQWVPVKLLWESTLWPAHKLVQVNGGPPTLQSVHHRNFRNTPPPPPEVWLLWRRQDDGTWYSVGFCDPLLKVTDRMWKQKVTCNAPDLR